MPQAPRASAQAATTGMKSLTCPYSLTLVAVGKLKEYRAKRDFERTPEPESAQKAGRRAKKPRFVVQEHHARRLHWDFRLEKDGVLVSWAVPRGIPPDPKRNHLAVHVEDHPLDYIDFHGEIPKGEYGGGKVLIWDHGTYETLKWKPDEVMVELHGERLQGRYVLFQTRGQDWMIHRMDPPQDPGREPMPEKLVPMLANLAKEIPKDEKKYGFEFKWDGIRAVMFIQGGRVILQTRKLEDVTARYPELRALGGVVGARELILDGEIIALDENGRPSFEQLQQRMGLRSDSEIRRMMARVPVFYMAFDLIYDQGHSLLALPYEERRERLEALKLSGGNWQTPPYVEGEGDTLLKASKERGLEGIMAKRLDSKYEPGRRSPAWLKIKNHQGQELVICGWMDGQGRRKGLPGALLLGYYQDGKLTYAGKCGTGFTDRMLDRLAALMKPLEIAKNPFEAGVKPPRDSHFIEPKLVGEFEFAEWTREGQLRAPSFKGLRDDKEASQVVREIAK
jgi:bifunctional non-homologous end joining protein LigD